MRQLHEKVVDGGIVVEPVDRDEYLPLTASLSLITRHSPPGTQSPITTPSQAGNRNRGFRSAICGSFALVVFHCPLQLEEVCLEDGVFHLEGGEDILYS